MQRVDRANLSAIAELLVLNLAPAGFQFGSYGTASHHAIIRPWNQH